MTHEIRLNDAYKGYTQDQDKIWSPEETVRRFKEKIRKVGLDILQSTLRIDNGRLGIPVYFSICGREAEEVIGTKKQMGKGGTPQQAEASAVMELAERFSFFSFSKNPGNFIVEEYRNISDRALPFEIIARSVHDDSDDLERAKEVFSGIPLRWTEAYNLTREREVLIPFDWFFAINEFNGPSAGNCNEEALLQGICEVVERHVSSIISQEKKGLEALDIRSATDPLVLEMIGKYEKIGVRLFASDFSLDTGIPSVGVLAYDPSTFPQSSEIVWTAGTTPSPQKALSRALTEVAQLAGDFNTGSCYVASGLPKFRTLEEAKYAMVTGPGKPLSAMPDLSHDNIRIEVERCISALEKIGMEVLVIDIKHPLLEIPSFYTIIPGAHFRERARDTGVGMFTAKLLTEKYSPERAMAELERMDELMPGKYYVHFYRGTCHQAMGEEEQALACFRKALDLNPKEQDVPTIYSYMAQSLKNLERYQEALSSLEEAERYDTERTDIYNLKGFCYFKLKEHERAIRSFQRVLELDPGSAIDYANIASNYREMGDREKAKAYYRFALELDPTIEFAKENLERLQQQEGPSSIREGRPGA
ncbi:MAG: YcaO-like family protein [Deltaproteobacteria bacterium]|nr:YcaO-like family protein [Deltaproteobacteria bacterium]